MIASDKRVRQEELEEREEVPLEKKKMLLFWMTQISMILSSKIMGHGLLSFMPHGVDIVNN